MPPQFSLPAFFTPTLSHPDPHSRTLSTILAWPDARLESSHNYIQYLFPLPEGSPYNPSAPAITPEVLDAFRTRPELRARLRECWERMLAFYGLEALPPAHGSEQDHEQETEGEKEAAVVRVVRGPRFSRQARNHWLMRFNHNHLRITRIIRSLRVLGCEREAEGFFVALRDACDNDAEEEGGGGDTVGARSLLFWTRAATRPLWVRPEVEEGEEGDGEGWLWEWEVGREGGGG